MFPSYGYYLEEVIVIQSETPSNKILRCKYTDDDFDNLSIDELELCAKPALVTYVPTRRSNSYATVPTKRKTHKYCQYYYQRDARDEIYLSMLASTTKADKNTCQSCQII